MTRWFAWRALPCADPIRHRVAMMFTAWAAAFGLMTFSSHLQAQATSAGTSGASAWTDPTRPPVAAADAGAAAPRSARAASAASAPANAAPQLQSLQVGTQGQSSALVDGRFVQAGDAVGAWRIVAIDADGLTLRDGQGRTQRLLLISAAIAKRDGGPAMPATASSTLTPAATPARAGGAESRPRAAVLTSGAATTAGTLGRGGREGQRP